MRAAIITGYLNAPTEKSCEIVLDFTAFLFLFLFLFLHYNGEVVLLAFFDDDELAIGVRVIGDFCFGVFDLFAIDADGAVGDVFSGLAFGFFFPLSSSLSSGFISLLNLYVFGIFYI